MAQLLTADPTPEMHGIDTARLVAEPQVCLDAIRPLPAGELDRLPHLGTAYQATGNRPR